MCIIDRVEPQSSTHFQEHTVTTRITGEEAFKSHAGQIFGEHEEMVEQGNSCAAGDFNSPRVRGGVMYFDGMENEFTS